MVWTCERRIIPRGYDDLGVKGQYLEGNGLMLCEEGETC
jgi:hypothetical protein